MCVTSQVVDFGAAASLADPGEVSRADTVTETYMPPELLRYTTTHTHTHTHTSYWLPMTRLLHTQVRKLQTSLGHGRTIWCDCVGLLAYGTASILACWPDLYLYVLVCRGLDTVGTPIDMYAFGALTLEALTGDTADVTNRAGEVRVCVCVCVYACVGLVASCLLLYHEHSASHRAQPPSAHGHR